MEKQVIRYKKVHFLLPSVVGIALIVIGLAQHFYGSGAFSMTGLSGLGVLWLGAGLHRWHSGYLTLTNLYIQRNGALPNKILLSEITEVKHFAGSYIIKYDKKELELDPNLVREDCKPLLCGFLEKLEARSVVR